jgi:hypothetical protein
MRRGSNAARFGQSGRALRQGQLAAQPRQQPAALGEHQQRRVARLRKLRVDQANRDQVAIPLHRVPVRQVRAPRFCMPHMASGISSASTLFLTHYDERWRRYTL